MIRASRMRMARKDSRMIRRMYEVTKSSSGIETNVTSARRQSRSSSTMDTPINRKMSPKIATTPCVTISVRASTSLVIRVISRPTGLRSKNDSERYCRWLNSRTLRSYIARWPIHVVSTVCEYRRPELASSTIRYSSPSGSSRARPASGGI